jgi:hypothetical protein
MRPLLLHFFGLLPHLSFSEGQIITTLLVWIGCFGWKVAAGFKVPANTAVDSCLGVKVTTGFKVPVTTRR